MSAVKLKEDALSLKGCQREIGYCWCWRSLVLFRIFRVLLRVLGVLGEGGSVERHDSTVGVVLCHEDGGKNEKIAKNCGNKRSLLL